MSYSAHDASNNALIQVIKDAIFREQQKIEEAKKEIFKLESELYDLGVELPLAEKSPRPD